MLGLQDARSRRAIRWSRSPPARCSPLVGWRFGAQPAALLWCGFCAALVALAGIDWDTTLLPDDLTLPLLWAGLVGARAAAGPIPLADALWGAVAGYLSLWSVYWLFKLTTGKEGMGFGDFKLLAALGAWLGWKMILPIVLLAPRSSVPWSASRMKMSARAARRPLRARSGRSSPAPAWSCCSPAPSACSAGCGWA